MFEIVKREYIRLVERKALNTTAPQAVGSGVFGKQKSGREICRAGLSFISCPPLPRTGIDHESNQVS